MCYDVIISLSDLPSPPEHARCAGFLALAGAFDDAPELAEALAGAVRDRHSQRARDVDLRRVQDSREKARFPRGHGPDEEDRLE
jgi:hypothetical protein